MVTTSMETTWKADNLLDRIRISEPLETRQNVGRAKQKSTTQKKKTKGTATTTLAGLTKKPGTQQIVT